MPDLLSYKPLVNRYLKFAAGDLAVFSFVNIFVWQDFFKFQFEEIDGNLCIFASDAAGTFLYLPPLGKKISPKAVNECFSRMKKLNKGKGITRIENVPEHALKSFSEADYKIYKKGYEYLYYRRDILELKGNAFKSKRNAYNHFEKNYSGEYRPYEPAMKKECLDLYQKWAGHKRKNSKDEIYLHMIEENFKVHKRALESYNDLDLIGRVVVVNNKVVAYTFGYLVNAKIFCDFCEVADIQFKGLPTYIFSRLCDDPILSKTEFINVMDDFEMENVTQTKLSFRPALMMQGYVISPLPK